MPPVHSAPATTTALVPAAAGSPSSRHDERQTTGVVVGLSSGSENSDNSDSEMSSGSPRASGSEDGSCVGSGGGPPPLVPRDSIAPAGVAVKVATCESLPSSLATGRPSPVPAAAAAIPLSVVQTSNKDPVLTTAILPHSEHLHFSAC